MATQDHRTLTLGLAGHRRDRALHRLAGQFAGIGLETPGTDARLLMAHALGLSKLALTTNSKVVLTETEARCIEDLALRRLQHEPVSRIIGERWFYGRPFKITPATLDPRAESETLIEAVLDLVAEMGLPNEQLRLLDIGTGTGCLLLDSAG